MFSKPATKTVSVKSDGAEGPRKAIAMSLIAENVSVAGDIASAGDIQLDGAVRGDVKVGHLSIGETGQVHGIDVNCWIALALGVIGVEVPGKVVPRRPGVLDHPLITDVIDHLGQLGGNADLIPIHAGAPGVKRNKVLRQVATMVPSCRR